MVGFVSEVKDLWNVQLRHPEIYFSKYQLHPVGGEGFLGLRREDNNTIIGVCDFLTGHIFRAPSVLKYDEWKSFSSAANTNAHYMGDHWNIFKDKRLLDMCVLSTHDTLTYDLSMNLSTRDVIPERVATMGNVFLTKHAKDVLRCMAKSQSLDITGQFEAGVRMFDIRTTTVKGEWFSVHSFLSNRNLSVYLTELVRVVEDNPKEVCVVTVSRHGVQGMTIDTPLDKTDTDHTLWNVITESMGGLLADHAKLPINSSTMQEIVASGKRIYLYIDGCDVIAPGESRAGRTDELYHASVLSNDISDLKADRYTIGKVFKDGCRRVERELKYCYAGLTSHNSSSTLIRRVLESGPALLRTIGKTMKSHIYSKLRSRGADPQTLLSFSQLQLYYAQY